MDNSLDVVSAIVFLLGATLDGRAAEIVGLYIVVILCGTTGAALQFSRRPPIQGRVKAVLFILFTVMASIVITVPCAEFTAKHTDLPARALFGPMALILGRYGEDLWRLGAYWVRAKVRRMTGGLQHDA